MRATIITIGEELLIGQVIDTNSAWLGQQLNLLGIQVVQQLTISDNAEAISRALDACINNSDIVITTGGLGPTRDDITKHTLAAYFNVKLVVNQKVLDHVITIVNKYKVSMNELNTQQAMVPENCTVLFNEAGTAPGMMFKHRDTLIFSMPGVPHEMKHIFTERIIPELKNKSTQVILHKTIHTIGIPESNMAVMLSDWEDDLPEEIALAYLPSYGKLRLRMTAKGSDEGYLKGLLNKQQQSIEVLLGDAIFGYDNESLQESIGKLLSNSNLTLSTAESCTGGKIASTIASVAGASNYFKGSVVAYDNIIKEKLLKVPHEVITANGAVSKDVVEFMSVGANELLETDFAIAVSGIAGPGGGTEEKPVGTIWLAIAYQNKKVWTEKLNYRGNREFNIERTTVAALNLLRKCILSEIYLKKEQ